MSEYDTHVWEYYRRYPLRFYFYRTGHDLADWLLEKADPRHRDEMLRDVLYAACESVANATCEVTAQKEWWTLVEMLIGWEATVEVDEHPKMAAELDEAIAEWREKRENEVPEGYWERIGAVYDKMSVLPPDESDPSDPEPFL